MGKKDQGLTAVINVSRIKKKTKKNIEKEYQSLFEHFWSTITVLSASFI